MDIRITLEPSQELRDLAALVIDALRAVATRPLATDGAAAWNAWAGSLAPCEAAPPATVETSPPVATAPASTHCAAPRRFGNEAWKWSPERKALALRLSEERLPRNTILARVNALPGDPIDSVDAMSAKLAQLRRKAREQAHAAIAPVASAQDDSAPAAVATPQGGDAAVPAPVEAMQPPVAVRAARPVRLPSAVPAPVPARPHAALPPVEVDAETALRWGGERGLDPHVLDLDAVNRKRVFHGLAPWVLRPRHTPRAAAVPASAHA